MPKKDTLDAVGFDAVPRPSPHRVSGLGVEIGNDQDAAYGFYAHRVSQRDASEIEPDRVITSRKRKLLSVQDLREAIARGDGPQNSGEFLVDISDRLVNRMSNVIEGIDDTEDELEEAMLTEEQYKFRSTPGGHSA